LGSVSSVRFGLSTYRLLVNHRRRWRLSVESGDRLRGDKNRSRLREFESPTLLACTGLRWFYTRCISSQPTASWTQPNERISHISWPSCAGRSEPATNSARLVSARETRGPWRSADPPCHRDARRARVRAHAPRRRPPGKWPGAAWRLPPAGCSPCTGGDGPAAPVTRTRSLGDMFNRRIRAL
jgi:hypothetical protein